MKRVCFFGAWDPQYPRNRILRAGLAHAGREVLEARVPEQRAWLRYPRLTAAFAKVAHASDAVFVPEFRHKDVPLARLLAGRRPLVFDPLVSRHDTLVGDWQLHGERSSQARWNRMLDRVSFSLPDLVLCDTWAHGELFCELGARRAKLRRVLVGAEDAFFGVPAPPAPVAGAGGVRILYVGGFLPLHGVRTIVDAAGELESRGGALPEYTLQLVGTGIEYAASRARATELKLERIEFTGALDYADAPRVFGDAHITLGAFGAGAKAGRVIPHKLYQGLAAGRAVVTGDGAGVREVFIDGEHLRLVPRGDAGALAAALASLIASAPAREALGLAARARALSVATPAAIGASLVEALAEVGA